MDNPLVAKFTKANDNLLEALKRENLDECAEYISKHNREYPKTWMRTPQSKCIDVIKKIQNRKHKTTHLYKKDRNNVYCVYGRYLWLKDSKFQRSLGVFIRMDLEVAEMERYCKTKNLANNPHIIRATAIYWCLGRAVLCKV